MLETDRFMYWTKFAHNRTFRNSIGGSANFVITHKCNYIVRVRIFETENKQFSPKKKREVHIERPKISHTKRTENISLDSVDNCMVGFSLSHLRGPRTLTGRFWIAELIVAELILIEVANHTCVKVFGSKINCNDYNKTNDQTITNERKTQWNEANLAMEWWKIL